MNKKIETMSKDILPAVLHSYSQVFFSTSKLLAVILLFVTFFDVQAGTAGLMAVAVTNLLAYFMGYNSYDLKEGYYGFNSLLVGLGLGYLYQFTVELSLLIVVAAVLTFFLTVIFQAVLRKLDLPFFIIPFLVSVWMVVLAAGRLHALNIIDRGFYSHNELFGLGGQCAITVYYWLEKAIPSLWVKGYFYSLGAIFFQTSLFAGIFISIGFLIYSRITFMLSMVGYAAGYYMCTLLGIEYLSVGFVLIGLNCILTAIALGYLFVPGRASYAWMGVLLPSAVLLSCGSMQVFKSFGISPYSLPYVIVMFIYLYALKLRETKSDKLLETPIQLGNPEKNLYALSTNLKRFPTKYPVTAALPFFGEWTVSQGHDSNLTHQDAWQHAWDFIVTDKSGRQFKGSGDFLEDYFCFGKQVIAPFDGTVVTVVNTIADNTVGDVDTKNNWGNCVIIKHGDKIYSKLCHLKYHSIEVKNGDDVKQGQVLGYCGNSGRSPYPHLHFQFQATARVGSPTLDYPLGHYLLKDEKITLETLSVPKEGQVVSNMNRNQQLSKQLNFTPGQCISGQFRMENSDTETLIRQSDFKWEISTDILNWTYIKSESDNAIAYLYNDGNIHYFTNFVGKKETPLYWFFLTLFKAPLGMLPDHEIRDSVPVNLMFNKVTMFFQDLIAPLYLFLRADYSLEMQKEDNLLLSDKMKFKSEISRKIAGWETKRYIFNTCISDNGVFEIEIRFNDIRITIRTQNK